MEEKTGPFQAIIKFWGTLNATQRFVCTAFISLSLVLLIIVSIVATRPHMSVLFSGLEADDAGTIVAKLKESNVPYSVEGSVIKVPEKHVHEMRMHLASEGLPQGSSVGFEIFDKSNLGMTEFSQRMNYQRAIQGELSRTINQLDGVAQSRVHIVVPKPTVFAEHEKETTASVVLRLRSGTQLNASQVGGIVHLVSSAVEGLKPGGVSIIDTNGNLLSEAGGDASGLDPRLSAAQLRLKREHERQMERDIQSMLERVLGHGKAIVRVNAKINLDRTEISSETYQPLGESNSGVLLSEERTEENYSAGAGVVGGIAGIRTNLNPDATADVSHAGDNGYRRTQQSSRYEVSKTIEHVVKAPGDIERLSVAVLVDGDIDEERMAAIRNTVATAAGIDLERRDEITVERLAFDDSGFGEQEKELEALASKETYLSIGKTAGAVVLLLAFLLFLKSILTRVNITVPEQVQVQEITAGPMVATEAYHEAALSGVKSNGGSSQPPSNVQPEEVAQVLRKWMNDN